MGMTFDLTKLGWKAFQDLATGRMMGAGTEHFSGHGPAMAVSQSNQRSSASSWGSPALL
jgi:hypothetical protein